jgi:hypothetical protein
MGMSWITITNNNKKLAEKISKKTSKQSMAKKRGIKQTCI